jgi:hypothetical protein
MAEQPPLNRSYVISYAGNDRDYPVIGLRLDPRVAGYRVPEDLSPHPDSKRYPNHVFTGSQPSNGDERVTHVYEILPAPWVPFTRYDDDLGPVQGRRRSVKNEGQEADLAADKKISYEGREGSAIVSNEIEETWSIKVDEDGNSLFPIKDRDFYDASRGAVQERRQLFVPTGEEVGTLENVGGVITQTSYEPYNEFLSVKVVQTYKVDGPQLIGNTTDNDGQLVTITTQRKAALDYVPPNPTATRTVEISREDAESLIERIIDTPEVFKADTFSVERPDPIPQKFRVAVPIRSSQEVVEGVAEIPTLEEGEISRSEEQRNKFLKRVSATSRDQTVLPQTLIQKSTNNERQEVTVTETLQSGDTEEVATATKTIESEALGDGNYVVRKTEIPEVFAGEIYRKTKEDLTPQKFRASQEEDIFEETIEGTAESPTLGSGEFAKSEQQVDKFTKRISTTFRDIEVATSLDEEVVTPEGIVAKRTLRLSKDPQSINPDEKLIDGSIEALGDGRTIKTEVRVPKIFAATTFSVERPDAVPQKFRVSVPVTTKQETIVGNAEEPSLGEGEITKSEQQTTEFLKRISTSSRDKTQLPKTLTQKTTTNEGQLATVEEKLQQGDTLEQPSATKTIESEAVGDGTYIVRKTEVPKIFAGASFRVTKADLTPEKFRASQEDVVKEETVAGNAEQPALSEGEFAKTEQQITEFVKRISTTKRSTEEAQELTESVLTNDGQIGVRKLTLSDGPQEIEESELVVDASIEALGDGRTIKTEVKVPEVFDARVLSVERPDTTPAKFRASVPVKTEQFTEKGAITEPVLQDGDLSKSEQQQTKYVKRVSTSSRDQTKLPSSLEQKTTNEFKQVVNIKETLQNGDTSVEPTATKTVESEALGNGNYVVRTSEVDDFFRAKSFSVESPDVVPVKFRSKSPTETTQEIIEGDAELPSLSDGEIAKSEQQQDEFLKRISTTTRDKTQLPVSLFQKTTTNDGLLAIVTETLKNSDTSEQPSARKTVESEAIGDGLYVERITNLPKIFDGTSFTVEAPDVLPAKFRAKIKTLTEQKTVEKLVAATPTLATGDLSKTEQRVTEFLVRETKISRDLSQEESLSQKTTNENLQLATVTETLQKTDTTEQPTATKTVESENLGDGNYVIRVTQVDKLFEAKSLSEEKTDTIPAKFRADIPTKTEQTNIEGTAPEPALSSDDISVTNQQINDRVYRETKVFRTSSSFPSLTQKSTTNEKQLATVTESISDSDTSESPSATKDVQSEALGDGKYLIRTTEVANVFPAKSVRASKLDLTPEKFKAKETSNTVETTQEGSDIPESITLGNGEFEKSEQQISEFVKRVSTTSRQTETTSILEERVVTGEGQVAIRTLTLSKGAQDIQSDPLLVDGSIEELGDGRTVKTEVRVGSVFDAKQESRQKPEVIPPEFRAALTDNTTVTTKEGKETAVSLEDDEVAKSIQRITEDKIRESVTVRAQGPYPSLTESIVDNDGLVITRVKTLVDGDQQISPSATTSGQVQALGDGYTLKTEDTKPKVFRGNMFSQEKPDNVPVEFRAEKPATTEEFSEEGEAAEVALANDEISKSEQQVTEFVKRTRKTTRDIVGGVTLSNGRQIDEDGIKVTVTRTLAQGSQEVTPSAKVRGSVEDIGDGKTIKTELTREKVFEGQTYSREKPDNIPAEFRAEKPSLVDEKIIEGEVEIPELEGDELAKSEQQITEFLKRIRTTTRENVDTVELTGEQTDQNKQKVTIKRTLSKSAQSITPSARISGDVQSLGDGYTIKTEQEVPTTFDQKSFSRTKPDTTPAKFRATIPTLVEETTFEDSSLEESDVSLSSNEISKSIQRIDVFTQRQRIESRDEIEDQQLVGGKIFTTELNGGIAEIIEEYSSDSSEIPVELGTISSEVENIGDNKFVKRSVKLAELSELSGTVYDEQFNIQIPYTRTIVSANEEQNLAQSAELTPRDSVHSLKTIYNNDEAISVLLEKYIQAAEVVNISLPDTLLSIKLIENFSTEEDSSSPRSSLIEGSSVDFTLVVDLKYTAEPVVKIKKGYSGPAEAVRHYFFLKEDNCNIGAILEKTSSQRWPVFKPQDTEFVINIQKFQTNDRFSFSLPDNKQQYVDQNNSVSQLRIEVPNTLHDIVIPDLPNDPKFFFKSDKLTLIKDDGSRETINLSSSASIETSLVYQDRARTSPTEIPSGNYLYSCSVTPYKYGLMRVEAVTIDLNKYK